MGGKSKQADYYGEMAEAITTASQMQAKSADKAMQIANEQFQLSLQYSQQQYNTARADVMPYISSGYAASEGMKEMLGLGEVKEVLPANAQQVLGQAILNHSVDFSRYKSTLGAYDGANQADFGQNTQVAPAAQAGYNVFLNSEQGLQTLAGLMSGTPPSGKAGGMGITGGPPGANINPAFAHQQMLAASGMSGATPGILKYAPGSIEYFNQRRSELIAQGFPVAQVGQALQGEMAAKFGPDWVSYGPNQGTPGLSLDQLSADKMFMDQWRTYGLPTERKFVPGSFSAEGQKKVLDALEQTPGYQFNLQQGLEGVQNSAAARGMLNSGNTMKEITQYGQGMAQNTFNDRIAHLSDLMHTGEAAATFTAQQAMQQGENVANMRSQLGDTLGSGEMAKGQALANGLLGSKRWSILGDAAKQNAKSSAIGQGFGMIGQVMGMFGGGMGGMAQGGHAKKGESYVMGETTKKRKRVKK